MGSDHDHWGQSWSGGGVGLTLNSSDYDGLQVTGGDDGVHVESAGHDGVYVHSADDDGVHVHSASSDGVAVTSAGLDGMWVSSAGDDGVYVGAAGSPSSASASARKNGFEVAGAQGHGLYVGRADRDGVYVESAGYNGVYVGSVLNNGVHVGSAVNNGVRVDTAGNDSVYVASAGDDGVHVESAGDDGVHVVSADDDGVYVGSAGDDGVHVYSASSYGVRVSSAGADGVYVHSASYDGVRVSSAGGYAGNFGGNVQVTGNLSKGSGSFKIDHPLDPENKYLYHSLVESPDMKNIYDGIVTLDENGDAWVELPEWFEALNRDFRYQLTPIGAPMPNLYIAREIEDNTFQIAGGEPGKKVSWQVTGIRHDPYAEANRILVEEDKPAEELGTYLHPESYGMPETKGLAYKEHQEHLAKQEARKTGDL
jgi:hypothetical protein